MTPSSSSMEKRRLNPLRKALLFSGALLILFISLQGFLLLNPLRDGGDHGAAGGFSGGRSRHHQQSAVVEQHLGSGIPRYRPPSASLLRSGAADAVLFPDWEAVVFHADGYPRPSPSDHPLCLFQDGSTSPAKFSRNLLLSHPDVFRCVIPVSIRGLRRILAPRIVFSSDDESPTPIAAVEIFRWNFIVYESFSTDKDVIVFAKGINDRRGTSDRSINDLRCVFRVSDAEVVRTRATSSSQEVFRCRHPAAAQLEPLLAASARLGEGIRISLEIRSERKVVPSLAEYRPPAIADEEQQAEKEGRSTLCACTMVFNIAKFLREWVIYHSQIGVERFILYDNGSEDELGQVLVALRREGYNVSVVPWLWPKTQEASFSHSAVAARHRCRWMMYLDVDEFAFSPSWSSATAPSSTMLRAVLPPANGSRIGQLSIECFDFGPSNRTTHPEDGVTQGYTCRRRHGERHKSIVLLEAVDPSLRNVIHHFKTRDGYGTGKLSAGNGPVVVNHYKYQAWPEFKAKFRRRASAFVADWTDEKNPRSKDRTPGLGFSAVEPPDWAGRFCEVRDRRLRDMARRWFCRREDALSSGDCRMQWATDLR